MSDNREQRPGDFDPADPWAPPNRDGVEVSKGAVPPAPPVHDQPTMTSMPLGGGPAGDVPPPPVAPGGPAAGAGTYGYPPAATPSTPAYGYPTTPAAPATPSYGYPPSYGGGYGGQPGWGAAPQNGMGTAGMVLGILAIALFCFYGVPSLVLGALALIFGILGRKRVQRGEANNSGQATSGIIMGAIGIALGILMIAFWGWFIANIEKFEDTDSGDPYGSSLVVDADR
ncbi:DUF4190 domain-containing protein [Streptomyces sp. NPDC003327]